jgi:2-oxo-4-hydroxy-4-carboxy-5-ureidoimidazoline decarboxylase
MSGALHEFNRLSRERAIGDLLSCCASPRWARAVASGRPYQDLDAVTDAAGVALARLDWPEIALALAAHPRIGQRPSGAGREAAWSRREQAGVDHSDAVVLQRLAEANRDYEERFGQVFLIFATGRSDAELLAEARRRLGNDEETERAVVRDELVKIVKLRLERLLA